MTPRPAFCGSGLCAGIFLVLVYTSLVKSQTTVSLELPSQITTSGNSTNLHKVSQEGNAPLSALNDGERKLPFQSSTTQVTILPGEWFKNSSSTFNNKEKHLPSNQAPLETTTTVEQVPGVQGIEDIDLKKSVKDEQPRKHLMEQLMANSRPQVQNDKQAISEFNDNDEYGDIEDNEKFGNREPTTPKSHRDPGVISLVNDTNVNYRGTQREHDVDVIMTKNPKLTQENATNVISTEPVVKLKDSKGQIEIIKNTTVPKSLKMMDADDFGKKIDKPKVAPLTAPDLANKTEENIDTGEVFFDTKKISKVENKTVTMENNGDDKNERNLPKGRTISFGGINQFSSEEVKAIGTKESAELGFTKEARPPYPYVKSSTSNPVNSSKLGGSTEEISALENTIGRSPDDKKLVITEPSVVIDNSIQQIKPTYFKRSGNVSRISNISMSEVPATPRPTETTELSNVTYPTVPKNTANDIPKSHEVIEKKNSLDLTENGLTEVPERNSTVSHESRATEANLVQNSTEIPYKSETIQPPSTSIDIQTNAEDSMLMVSPLNVTEDSTKLPTTTFKPSPPESTLNPSIFSPSTSVTDETLATTVEEVSTTLVPETVSSSSTSQTSKTELRNFTGRGIDSESTTSGVEYEFIGLTETTASPSYASSSDAGNMPVSELPVETSLGTSTTNSTSIIQETTDVARENSTQPEV